jgi:hypothetical protein
MWAMGKNDMVTSSEYIGNIIWPLGIFEKNMRTMKPANCRNYICVCKHNTFRNSCCTARAILGDKRNLNLPGVHNSGQVIRLWRIYIKSMKSSLQI